MNERDCWSTPDVIVELARSMLGVPKFDMDAAADSVNTKADFFYSESNSGLESPWAGNVWCNPPYSDIEPWVDKALAEIRSKTGPQNIAMLLPANRTEQDWFQKLQSTKSELGWTGSLYFLPKRVRFIPPAGVKPSSPRFASVLVLMRKL